MPSVNRDRPEEPTVIARCVFCERDVRHAYRCPNNPDDAVEVRIGGYWGSTAFDGSDMTGEFLWGVCCDDCLLKKAGLFTEPSKAPDWPSKPRSFAPHSDRSTGTTE